MTHARSLALLALIGLAWLGSLGDVRAATVHPDAHAPALRTGALLPTDRDFSTERPVRAEAPDRPGSHLPQIRAAAPACRGPAEDGLGLSPASVETGDAGAIPGAVDHQQLGTLGLGFLAGIAAADLVTTGGAGTVGMLMKGGISALAVMSFGELQDRLGIRKEDLYGAGMGVLAGIALADLIGTGGLGTAAVIGIGGLMGGLAAKADPGLRD